MCRRPPWSFAGNSDLPDAANATQSRTPKAGIRHSRGSGNPGGGVGAVSFHTLVCRRQPAGAITMKACPGLRSGIAA